MGSPGALAGKLERLHQEGLHGSLRPVPTVDDSVVAISRAYSEIGK